MVSSLGECCAPLGEPAEVDDPEWAEGWQLSEKDYQASTSWLMERRARMMNCQGERGGHSRRVWIHRAPWEGRR